MAPLDYPKRSTVQAVRRLPERISDGGILVGWSMEPKHPHRPMGFTYGEPDKVPSTGYIDPIQLAREGHLITIAPTGAGKGRGCIIPALLQHDGPVIVIDPKGENVAITARARREMGQQVIVLDPMHVTDQPTAALNPLDIIDIKSPLAVDEVSVLVQSMWVDGSEGRDRFWIGRGQQVLIGLILHLLADYEPHEHNFRKLREILSMAVADPSTAVKNLEKSLHPEVRLIAQAFGIAAPETLGSILSFSQEMIDFLRGPLIQQATEETTFDLDGVTRGDPLAIYLVLPPHMLESHGRLLRMWVSALLACITRRRAKPEKRTLFILDEAAQLGALPQLRQAVTLLRGYGLQTWSFWQDVSQLKMLYPLDWQTMVNNCAVLQCFGALNMNAAADMGSLTGFGLPEQVIELNHDEMILQLAGDEAVVARLPDYLQDPPFSGRFDPNPYYAKDGNIMPKPIPPIREYQRPSAKPSAASTDPQDMPAIPRVTNDPETWGPFKEALQGPISDEPDPLHERLLALWDVPAN